MEEITLKLTVISALAENKHTIISVELGQKKNNMLTTIFHLENMPLIILKTLKVTNHSSQETNSDAGFII